MLENSTKELNQIMTLIIIAATLYFIAITLCIMQNIQWSNKLEVGDMSNWAFRRKISHLCFRGIFGIKCVV